MRIASMIASATEIVHALGLTEFQVARSHECDWPLTVKALPVCTRPRFDISGSSLEIDKRVKETLAKDGTLYEVFPEILNAVAPTHIITQTQCKVCAVSMEDVERAVSSSVASHPEVIACEPNSLQAIFDDINRIAGRCGYPQRGLDLVASLEERMSVMGEQISKSAPVRVACIEWIEPLMAAGNWTPELVKIAGGINLFGEEGKHSPWMEWQDLAAARPEVVIVMPCGFGLERTRDDLHWITDRPEFPGPAQWFLADGNHYFNRPGPRVVECVRILAEILHPQVFKPRLEGVAWQRL